MIWPQSKKFPKPTHLSSFWRFGRLWEPEEKQKRFQTCSCFNLSKSVCSLRHFHYDNQLFIWSRGRCDETSGVDHLHTHIPPWAGLQCWGAVSVLHLPAQMDRDHYLHDQSGSDGPAAPLPSSVQDARCQPPLACPPPAALLLLRKSLFCWNIWQHLHHHEYSCGPMVSHMSPV